MQCSFRGHTVYPIMMSMGNLSTEDRHRAGSKAVVAFLPVVKHLDESERLIYHEILHQFWGTFLEPLRVEHNTIFSFVDCDGRHCLAVVRLALIISDQPEAATLSGTSGTTNTAQACAICHCPTDRFSDVAATIRGEYPERTEAGAKATLATGDAAVLKTNRYDKDDARTACLCYLASRTQPTQRGPWFLGPPGIQHLCQPTPRADACYPRGSIQAYFRSVVRGHDRG